MEKLSRIQLERTLSIQSCFPGGASGPDSGASTYDGFAASNTNPQHQHVLSLHLTYSSANAPLTAPPNFLQNEFASGPLTVAAATQILSSSSYLAGRPMRNLTMYVPLYRAALNGDWGKARDFISLHPHALTARITKGRETALHIAAGAKQIEFVEELVKLMDPVDLKLQNKYDNTALCFAAASGITRIAELMVRKNQHLPMVRGSKGVLPLHMAALLGHRNMVWYLNSVTDSEYLSKEDYVGLLIAVISSDLYDVALHILQHKPELAIERDPNGETPLHVLARKPSAFSSKMGLGFWQRCIYSCIHVQLENNSRYTSAMSNSKSKLLAQVSLFKSKLLQHQAEIAGVRIVSEKKLMHMQALELLRCLWRQVILLDDSQIGDLLRRPLRPLFVAAENGNFEFITELLHSYPDLIWKVDEESRSIFHIAVIHRQEKIFGLIYDIGAHKDLIASYKSTDNSNILHLAAKLAPSDRLGIVSGAALQMQRELLWFKEVEKIVQPLYKEMKDSEGQTPRALFSDEHKRLVKSGERWMKDTSSSCMLVATLITTVMFAAIFTVPGGNNNNTGTPIFLQSKSFIIFSISDAFALFSSVTSILMFLSILTARYAEHDFLESLPKKLIIGLTTLFFSIASMLIAFSASFFIVVRHHLAWIIIPVALIACIPVTLFAFLQFPLLADSIRSTYGWGIFCGEGVHIFL